LAASALQSIGMDDRRHVAGEGVEGMELAGADRVYTLDPLLLIGQLSGCGSKTILWEIATCHAVVALTTTTETSRGLYFDASM
jgi:hypothetical protein